MSGDPLSIVSAISAIISGFTDLYQFVRDGFRGSPSPNNQTLTTPISGEIQFSSQKLTKRYQELLGERHKFLRKKILKINCRKMADFYGFEKVSYLEDCENGLDEFPTESIKKLEKFFFINPNYLQEGSSLIFGTFDIIGTSKDCSYYLEQGFRPCFLCDPDFKRNGLAYLLFWKEDTNYYRMIQSNTWGGFYSSVGGYHNIANLIKAMLDLNFSASYVSFISANDQEWKLLEKNCFYDPSRFYRYRGDNSFEAQNIFERWYKEIQN